MRIGAKLLTTPRRAIGRRRHFDSAFSICNTSGHSKRPPNSENDLKMTGGIQLKEGDEFGIVDSAGLLFHVDKKMRLDDKDVIHNDYGAINKPAAT